MAIIIPGANSAKLAGHIARLSKCGLVDVERKLFPDGDRYVRLAVTEKIGGGDDVFVLGSTWPNQDSALFELMLLADAATLSGAKTIRAVIPYMSYSRQDKKFLEGEPLSLDVILRALKSAGVSSILTVDSHFMRASSSSLGDATTIERCGMEITSLSAYPLLLEKVTSMVKRPVIIAPDKSMEAPLKKFGEVLVIEKSRDRVTGKVSAVEKLYPVDGKDVVLVDDMISAGGTMIKAAQLLSKSNPASFTACCTHGLFVEGADKRMIDAGITRIVSTDTIDGKYSEVSVAQIIADAILDA